MKLPFVCILFAIMTLACPAGAQEQYAKFEREMAQAKAFLPVYGNYMGAINTEGIAGLRKISAADFTLKWDRMPRKGENAFAELEKYVPSASDASLVLAGDSVKMRRLFFVGDRAIVQIEEKRSLRSKGEPAGNMSVTYYWKHTWRKTARGWRLAVWETGSEKLLGPKPVATYTIDWKPKNAEIVPLTPK